MDIQPPRQPSPLLEETLARGGETGVSVHCSDYRNRYELRFWVDRNDHRFVSRPMVFESTEDTEYAAPAISMSSKMAQDLMDELWRAGLRPADGTGSSGQLAATERHLDDMRAIAAHKIGAPLPERKR